MSRPNISYGDILNSMNVSLVNGVLVYKRGDTTTAIPSPSPSPASTTKQVKISREPIPEEIKKSKVYNKYFSDYKDPNDNNIEVRTPQTVEEYRQMLLEDKVKNYLAQKRANRIKSKKMFFSNPPAGFSVNADFNLAHTFHFK